LLFFEACDILYYEQTQKEAVKTEKRSDYFLSGLFDGFGRTGRNRRFFVGGLYFSETGVWFMNILLLVAFGLVALGSIIRLVLFFTRPKQ
jgi:hypothetical protein